MKKKLLLSIIFTILITGCSNTNSTSEATYTETKAENEDAQDQEQTPDDSTSAELQDDNKEIQSSDLSLTFDEKATMDNYTIELQQAFIKSRTWNGNEFVLLVFEFENKSSSDLRVDYNDFDCYADDYLGRNWTGGNNDFEAARSINALIGNLAPNKKMVGYVSFALQEGFQVMEARYTDKDGNHITYTLNREQFEISN